jgi:hypothetical protein
MSVHVLVFKLITVSILKVKYLPRVTCQLYCVGSCEWKLIFFISHVIANQKWDGEVGLQPFGDFPATLQLTMYCSICLSCHGVLGRTQSQILSSECDHCSHSWLGHSFWWQNSLWRLKLIYSTYKYPAYIPQGHCVSSRKTSWLVSCQEKVTIYCTNYTDCINKVGGKMQFF